LFVCLFAFAVDVSGWELNLTAGFNEVAGFWRSAAPGLSSIAKGDHYYSWLQKFWPKNQISVVH